jgi:hypothetical protein
VTAVPPDPEEWLADLEHLDLPDPRLQITVPNLPPAGGEPRIGDIVVVPFLDRQAPAGWTRVVRGLSLYWKVVWASDLGTLPRPRYVYRPGGRLPWFISPLAEWPPVTDDAAFLVPAHDDVPRPAAPEIYSGDLTADLRTAVGSVRAGLEQIEQTIHPSSDIGETVRALYGLAPTITDLGRALSRWAERAGL